MLVLGQEFSLFCAKAGAKHVYAVSDSLLWHGDSFELKKVSASPYIYTIYRVCECSNLTRSPMLKK